MDKRGKMDLYGPDLYESEDNEDDEPDVPKIVQKELDRRRAAAKTTTEQDLGLASPEIVKAFKDHVKEGRLTPYLRVF